MQFVNFGKLAS